MCSIKFLVRIPWLYALAGFALLALMCFSILDANRVTSTQSLESFQAYSGKLTQVQTQAAFKAPQAKGDAPVQTYVYQLTLELDGGGEKIINATVIAPLTAGMHVLAHVNEQEKGKVYNLVANGQALIDHQSTVAQALLKAEKARGTMTHPVTILFIGLLICFGIGGEVFKRRRPDLHAKYSMCAIDRIKALEEAA